MDWLASAAERAPDAPAIVTPEGSWSYQQLDRAATVVASIIVGSGLGGGTVAFWGERDPASVAAVWGIPRAGATAVPVDSRWPPAEAMELTRVVGARGLWALPDGGIDRLLERAPASPPSWGPPDEDARFVLFTSGSEGRHLPVVITGENIAASVAGSRDRLGNGPDDAWLALLPLFHVGGLSILWRQAEQAAPVILEPGFDAARAAELSPRCGFASVVPTMLRRMLAAGLDSPGRLEAVLVGGGPVDRGLLERAIELGIPTVQTYGLTEAASQVCTVEPGSEQADLGTAGRPIRGAEVRISDGRIEVRGPMVTPGYLGEPERAADEWWTTGDLGEIDGEGRLTVIGRADEMIISGGENIHPAAVAGALRDHPGVVGARVFGIPDDEWGRRVVAEVVLDGISVDELASWARRRLLPHEVPREWRAVDAVTEKLV